MSKGDETRTLILDEAVVLASRVGFSGLSIGGLADQVSMSKSGLFAHFRSKEQLQLRALERARERFADVVLRPALTTPRGEQRVRAVFDGWIAWISRPGSSGCPFVAAATELDDQPGPLREALVRNERDWLELLAQVAGTAVSEGHFAADVDVDQFAYEVHGLMLAHHHGLRLMEDPLVQERTRRAFERLVSSARA